VGSVYRDNSAGLADYTLGLAAGMVFGSKGFAVARDETTLTIAHSISIYGCMPISLTRD
jgi:hypothetical protein